MANISGQRPDLSPLEAQAQLWQAGTELAMAGLRFMSAASAVVMSQAASMMAVGTRDLADEHAQRSPSATVSAPYVARGSWRDQPAGSRERAGAAGVAPWPFDGAWQPWLAVFPSLAGVPQGGAARRGSEMRSLENLAGEAMARAIAPWLKAALPPMARPFVTPWLPAARDLGPADELMEAWAEAVMAPARERWIAITIEAWTGGLRMPSGADDRRPGQLLSPWLPWLGGPSLGPWLRAGH